jgi:serine/threonine protein kinase/tetratricopeptide (TPR) repeat protein
MIGAAMAEQPSAPGEEHRRSSDPDAPVPAEDRTAVDLRGPSQALLAADIDAVEPGTRMGRYMILEVVGSGGVGIVYAAYDPSLDRKVALKQLRRSKLVGQTEAVNQRRSRLRREAQALARLSHPNVVPVYEVASFDDQIYVVMEFVEGSTLREWLAEERRGWSEIVGLFVQAGRGLAAAHAGDIVHRDFKPDNVRVGADGRVRVLDFGLAAPLPEAETERSGSRLHELLDRAIDEDSAAEADSRDDSWTESGERSPVVTREGQVMGTPAYMAPEQASGGLVDARSDQFSFCVALYEALYGVRPFRGRFDNPRRFRDLSRARTLPGNPPEDLPAEIEKVLIRGLRLAPEHRYESMDALLADLTGVARGPRRLWWVPVSTMLLALLAVVAFYERRSVPAAACDDGSGMLEGVWDEAVAVELRDAALSSGQPYAPDTWDTAAHGVHEWAQQWSRSRRRACEATHVHGDQSPGLLEHRIACLDLQLIRVESTLAGLRRLEDRPEELLERLTTLALPSPDACAAANVLERRALEPANEKQAGEAAELRQALAEVEGWLSVGEFAEARDEGERELERARELGFEPVEAEALLLVGLALTRLRSDDSRAEAVLREAAWAAERSGHDAVLVRAAAAQAAHLGAGEARLELAKVWAELARAALERHGEDPEIEPEVRRHLGSLAMTAGDYETALGEYRRALDLARETGGERSPEYIASLRAIGDAEHELGRYEEASETLGRARMLAAEALGAKHPTVPEVLDSLASVEASRGAFGQALELHRMALRINEEIFGPEHRRVAKNLNNMAILYDKTGRYLEAVETLESAREVLVKHLGAEHPDVAFVDVNIGSALQNLGRQEEARGRYELALGVLERSLGPEHMAVGVTLQNLGSTRSALGDGEGALVDFERSQAVLEQAFGERHPSLATLELNRARALRRLHRYDEALAANERALAMREAIFGPEHAQLVEVLTGLVETELALDHPQRALEHGERALRLAGEGNTPTERAQVRMVLADAALVAQGESGRERAEALVLEAFELLETAEGSEEAREEVERWLAEHGVEPPTPG